MKIYIASSWKNAALVLMWKGELERHYHEVDAFCDCSSGRFVFNFAEIENHEQLNAIDFLLDKRTQKAFQEDKKWLDWADCCLLILPAGNSAHLEAGYAKGKGKLLIVWQDEFPAGEFDVMYGFADLVTDSAAAVLERLGEEKKR